MRPRSPHHSQLPFGSASCLSHVARHSLSSSRIMWCCTLKQRRADAPTESTPQSAALFSLSGRLVAPDSAVAGCRQLHVAPQTCRSTQTRFCGRLSDPTRPGSRSASHHIHSVVFFVPSRSLRLLPFPSPPCACPFRDQRVQFIPFQLSRLSDTTATLQVVGSSAAGRVRVGSKYVPLPS